MSPLQLAVTLGVVALGAVVQGSVGIGLGMLAAPILVLIEPALVPGPLLCAALGLTFLIAHRDRSAIDFRGLSWAIVGRVPGTVLGAAVLALVPQRQMILIVGGVVLLAVILVGSGFHWHRSRWTLFGAGTLSGFMATTASIGGPPMALLYQDAPGARMRGTLSGFFVVGLLIALGALAGVGRFGRQEIVWAGVLLPGILLGFAVSHRFARLLDRGYTRRAVLAVSALAGILVIVRALA